MNYPQTIDSGHGETLTFCGIESCDGQARLKLRGVVAPGSGPPMHVHFHQTEHLAVKQGQLWYQIEGQDACVIGPGESVTFAPGEPHTFKAFGEGQLECEGWVSPPDNNAYFLSQVYASARKNDAGGRPSDWDMAFLLGRYGGEYDVREIPTPVKKLVFPVLRLLGTLTGRFRHFAGAPEPLHRG